VAATEQATAVTSSTVPAGYTIDYYTEPKRAYFIDGVEVPSVTTVLGCLDKPGLPWWGMTTGVAGVLQLAGSGILRSDGLDLYSSIGPERVYATTESVVALLTENKLTVNHQRDKAGIRGVGAHNAFEVWALDGQLPDPAKHPFGEMGYVTGLFKFCKAMGDAWETHGVEVTVGSKEHGFAGRYDLRGKVTKDVRLVAKATTQAGKPLASGPKFTTIPAGTSLLIAPEELQVHLRHSPDAA